MCIMEVRVGQHSSTIAQAVAHNLQTVSSDLDLFREVMKKRDDEYVRVIDNLADELSTVIRHALNLFGSLVEAEVTHLHNYHTNDVVGNERLMEEVADEDIARAAEYETRR